MDNITKINDIKYLIMEFYSDQEPLTEEQQKSKECFFCYCDEIRAELKAFDALSKDDEKAKKELSKEIEKNRVLEIIFEAPSILQQLFELGQLGEEATQRYMWGTITDSRVQKVKEFFADGKRDQSK